MMVCEGKHKGRCGFGRFLAGFSIIFSMIVLLSAAIGNFVAIQRYIGGGDVLASAIIMAWCIPVMLLCLIVMLLTKRVMPAHCHSGHCQKDEDVSHD